jgi:hypothetical protein
VRGDILPAVKSMFKDARMPSSSSFHVISLLVDRWRRDPSQPYRWTLLVDPARWTRTHPVDSIVTYCICIALMCLGLQSATILPTWALPNCLLQCPSR